MQIVKNTTILFDPKSTTKILYFCKLYCKRLKSLNQGKTVFAQIMAHTKKLILQMHKDHKKAIV